MPLVMKKDSRWFYAKVRSHGKEFTTQTGIEIMGKRPATLRDKGDSDFEESRKKATAVLDEFRRSSKLKIHDEEKAIAHAKVTLGRDISQPKINELISLWNGTPRSKHPTDQHIEQCHAVLCKFRDHVQKGSPELVYVSQITKEHIRSYRELIQVEEGLTDSAWNRHLSTLRTALKQAGSEVAGAKNFKRATEEAIHREPFTIEELQDLFDLSYAHDRDLYGIIVTGATTAQRRKDCCLLQWSSIDIDSRLVSVRQSKSGRKVTIPMADILFDVISAQMGNGSEFVFPQMAAQYMENPNQIGDRFKKIMRLAGFRDNVQPSVSIQAEEVGLDEIRGAVERHLTGKRARNALAVSEAYLSGLSLSKSAASVGCTKSTASKHLNDLEGFLGKSIIRNKRRVVDVPETARGAMQIERKNGGMRASVKGFHSFRTTWTTLALMNGLPVSVIQLVTGHATAEVVLENYFNPETEELRKKIQQKMPGLLSSQSMEREPIPDWVSDRLKAMTMRNWEAIREELLGVE